MKNWVNQRIGKVSLQTGIIVGLCALGFFILFIFRLGTLTPGLSAAELSARGNSSSIHAIVNDPVNAPHKTIQYAIQAVGIQNTTALRLVSVFWAGVFLVCFFYLAKRWFGKTIGLLGTVLLAGTPWLVVMGRSMTPTILLLMPLVAAACFVWLWRTKNHSNLAAICFAIATAITIYVPGAIWFILLAGILSYKRLKIALKKSDRLTVVLGSLLIALLVSPLVRATIIDPSIVKPLFLVPDQFGTVVDQLKSLGWSFLGIFWHTRDHQVFNVGRWSMLSGPQLVLLIFGVFAMATQAKKEAYILFTFTLAAVIAAAINANSILLIIALPSLIMLATAGLRYLYVEWRTVFPLNPIPKTLAITLMVALVAIQFIFGAHYVLSAWAHSPSTQSTYMLK